MGGRLDFNLDDEVELSGEVESLSSSASALPVGDSHEGPLKNQGNPA
jgi:hypothetical protein